MSNYQIIPRKYRPQAFSDVIGQEAIVTTLKNALKQGRLAHAYLFCGTRGTGKTTFARVFAKALNCQNLTSTQEPCNTCPSCLEITSGRSLDVLEIDGASNRGIDDIRQINETIGYAPASGKFKIYIIDEVHMLTKEAFNALLKTLEEPPPNVKFFFATTEPHKVLPTIISRCQRFDLNRISREAMQAKLVWIAKDLNAECDTEALALIVHLSEGSLRDAESLLDQIICFGEKPITLEKVQSILGMTPRSHFFKLDHAMETQNLSYAFELAQTIFSSGKDLTYFLDTLVEHVRTLIHVKLNSRSHSLSQSDHKSYLGSAAFYTQEQCLYILDYLIQWQQNVSKTPFKRICIEMILLHIIRSKNRILLSTLTQRLIELESSLSTHKPIPVENPPIKAEPITVVTHEKQISIEQTLLKKMKERIEEKAASTPLEEIIPSMEEEVILKEINTLNTSTEKSLHPSRYETLIRFAAVELEGIIKKN